MFRARFFVFLLIFGSLQSSFGWETRAANPSPGTSLCAETLSPQQSAWMKAELRLLASEEGYRRRLAVNLNSPWIQYKAKRRILAEQLQDEDQIRLAVRQTALRLATVEREKAGYAFLVSVMIGSVWLTNHATESYGKDSKFLTTLFSMLGTLGLYQLGGAVWLPISSFLNQLSAWITKGIHPMAQGAVSAEDALLDESWFATQGTYTVNRQLAGGRLHHFLMVFDQTLERAWKAMNEKETPEGRRNGIEKIAGFAIRTRHIYRDIMHDHEDVGLAVRTGLLNHVSHPERVKLEVREAIHRLDAKGCAKVEVRDYYDLLLDRWFSQ